MGVYVPGMKMPECCLECIFKSEKVEHMGRVIDGEYYYQKISHCLFHPEEIEDPWRTTHWMAENKEKWCPLKEIEFQVDLVKED